MRAQKIQLLDVVVGIEQRAALGGAGLMIEAERRALILARRRGPARSRLTSRDSIGRNAPRFSRERCASEMIAACAAFGANAPNGAGDGSLSGVKRCVLESKRRMHSRFCDATSTMSSRRPASSMGRVHTPRLSTYSSASKRSLRNNPWPVDMRRLRSQGRTERSVRTRRRLRRLLRRGLRWRRKRPSSRRLPLRGMRSMSLTSLAPPLRRSSTILRL